MPIMSFSVIMGLNFSIVVFKSETEKMFAGSVCLLVVLGLSIYV